MQTAKLFMSGDSQAVRLPKAFRFTGEQVYIKKMGNGVLLLPYENGWQIMFDALAQFSPGLFADERQQPVLQTREELEELFDELSS